jgi:hypothetical protein
LREYFKEEAGVVTQHLKGVHHTRKDAYMQVAYASTVDKLSSYQKESSLNKSTYGIY